MRDNNVLYLGLELPPILKNKNAIHYPIIKIVPYPIETQEIQIAFRDIPNYTHLIFTSKSTVYIFFQYMASFGFTLEQLHGKDFIAVGQATAKVMQEHGIEATIVPTEETAEGIVRELRSLSLEQAHIFWPHSALSRRILTEFFEKHSLCYTECLLYETQPHCPALPVPDFSQIDEIIFTSPSTVNAFIEIFGELPKGIKLTSIGPITQSLLKICDQR
jgi:uroporphyrinogen-III synthase